MRMSVGICAFVLDLHIGKLEPYSFITAGNIIVASVTVAERHHAGIAHGLLGYSVFRFENQIVDTPGKHSAHEFVFVKVVVFAGFLCRCEGVDNSGYNQPEADKEKREHARQHREESRGKSAHAEHQR